MKRIGLLVVAVLLVACSTEGDVAGDVTSATPSPEAASEVADDPVLTLLSTGSWRDSAGGVWRFSADGTYTVQDGGYETGTWSFEDEVLTVTTADGSRYCEGTTGRHRLVFDESGRQAEVEALDDSCEERRQGLAGGRLEQRQSE